MAEKLWQIEDDRLVHIPKENAPHSDRIEMSGLFCDLIMRYGTKEDGTLDLAQIVYFPALRTIPNNTHATFGFRLTEEERPTLCFDGLPVTEYPVAFALDGTLTVKTKTQDGAQIARTVFPSVDTRFSIEMISVTAPKDIRLSLSHESGKTVCYGRGTKGVYLCKIYHTAGDALCISAGETASFAIYYTAEIANSPLSLPDAEEELQKRKERVSALADSALILHSGHETLDTMTRFAKIRAGESIFETLTGKYHSPGGHSYYAAIWCNDQVEYAGPHFALTGDKIAIEASLNAYRAYVPFMSDSYHRLPSSIIAEGLDIWEGAGDRGDAAMYLYGASFFVLALGDEKIARELYPAIRWCAEYCERKKTDAGVISSDSDELEGRFPTDGVANLSTSSLAYGGLCLASKLAASLGDGETAALYQKRADDLEEAIEKYFGATLHGFETYRYSKGFDTLRAWICLPIAMGIDTRREGTLNAMLSPYLFTEEGMLSCERGKENTSDTIWDRATLYGMKAAFLSGAGERMQQPLLDYTRRRLLTDRVPYAVEAYPEGGKRHLSGESALFVRVVTEGLFGILPESLTSFSFIPRLPSAFPYLSLSNIHIAGDVFDITVRKEDFEVAQNGVTVARGKTDGKRTVINRS